MARPESKTHFITCRKCGEYKKCTGHDRYCAGCRAGINVNRNRVHLQRKNGYYFDRWLQNITIGVQKARQQRMEQIPC